MSYERDNIRRLQPYTPGEQPRQGPVIKLNTNENPYPPPPAVLQAIAAVSGETLRRYPPPLADQFRQVAARVHGLTPEQVIATNGGDELLRLAVTVFCRPTGDTGRQGGIGMANPTYSLYLTLGQIHDTPVVTVPLNPDWSLPDDFACRLREGGCKLVILVNPQSPSGCLHPLAQLARFARELQGQAVLLIDEAYVDFAEHDALSLLDAREKLANVLLLRTLSKGYSLAGLRFGYGLGSPQLIAALDKARDSYNTDILAQTAAIAALEHRDEAARTWKTVIEQRQRLVTKLRQRGYDVPNSQSNFLLAQPPTSGLHALELYQALKQKGILVRYFNQPRLSDRLRITVGTPQQNDALLRALDELAS